MAHCATIVMHSSICSGVLWAQWGIFTCRDPLEVWQCPFYHPGEPWWETQASYLHRMTNSGKSPSAGLCVFIIVTVSHGQHSQVWGEVCWIPQLTWIHKAVLRTRGGGGNAERSSQDCSHGLDTLDLIYTARTCLKKSGPTMDLD